MRRKKKPQRQRSKMQKILEEIKSRGMGVFLDHYGIPHRHRKSVCPFHEERTASFSWKGFIFKCFGCGAGGDAVTFIRKMEGLGFRDAVARASQILGIPYKEGKPKRNYYLEALNENYEVMRQYLLDDLEDTYSMLRCYGRRVSLTLPMEHDAEWFSQIENLNNKIEELEEKLKELTNARQRLRRNIT